MNFEKKFNQPQETDKEKEQPVYKTVHGVRYEVVNNQKNLAPPPKFSEPEISRRGFLKAALGLGGAAIAGSAVFKSLEKTADFAERAFEQEPMGEKTREQEEKPAPTPEQAEIEKEDFVTTAEILDFKKPGKIEFNSETVELIKNGWKKKYRENPKLKESFARAYREMGCWQPYLEDIFRKQGVPKEYIFLAIPESHWQPQAVSPAGATGPYQFMRSTAKLFGLKIEKNYDERKDPLASANACAKLLADLYQRTKDWNLALSGYNGSFLWKYLKENAGQDKKATYPNYLKFVENILNDKKTKIKNLSLSEKSKERIYLRKIRGYSENVNYPAKFLAVKELIEEGFVREQEAPVVFQEMEFGHSQAAHNFYKIAKGDTLFSLSRRFKTKPADIAILNPQAKNGLKIGQEIRLPAKEAGWLSLREIAARTGKPIERLAFLNPSIKIDSPLPKARIRV